MTKAEAIFRKVLATAQNHARAEIAPPPLKELLGGMGLTPSDWYPALGWARKRDQEAYRAFYAARGTEPQTRAPRGADAGAAAEGEADEDVPPPGRARVLGEIVAWLELAEPADRPMLLASAGALYGIKGAFAMLDSPGSSNETA